MGTWWGAEQGQEYLLIINFPGICAHTMMIMCIIISYAIRIALCKIRTRVVLWRSHSERKWRSTMNKPTKSRPTKHFFFVYLMGMGYYYFHYNILLLLLLAPIFSVRLFLRFLGEFRRAPEALDSQPEKKKKKLKHKPAIRSVPTHQIFKCTGSPMPLVSSYPYTWYINMHAHRALAHTCIHCCTIHIVLNPFFVVQTYTVWTCPLDSLYAVCVCVRVCDSPFWASFLFNSFLVVLCVERSITPDSQWARELNIYMKKKMGNRTKYILCASATDHQPPILSLALFFFSLFLLWHWMVHRATSTTTRSIWPLCVCLCVCMRAPKS